jgi:methionine aminopeptidase
MAKINFTKDHFAKLQHLALGMLFTNEVIVSRIGTPLNIVELIHTTTIGTLNEIRLSLGKAIEKLENQDEWTSTEDTQTKLESLKLKKELVNLIIGYKRFNLENEANARKKAELEAKLKELEESQKSPADKIAELKAEIAQLDTEEF